MSTYIIDSSDLTEVAEAIRQRGGTTELLGFPSEMAEAIEGIPYDSEPTGTTVITTNDIHDVKNFAYADVQVPQFNPTETITIDHNDIFDVGEYKYADVQVPGINPTGSVTLNTNGRHTVRDYYYADVDVPTFNPSGTKSVTVNANGTVVENVRAFDEVAITASVSIGDYSQVYVTTLTPETANTFTILHTLGVVPKLVTVEPATSVVTGRLMKGVFIPAVGVMTSADPLTSTSLYAYRPLEINSSTTAVKVFYLTSSSVIIRSYANGSASNNTWDTSSQYKVQIYA